ncbi:MAG: glutamine-hydrolyzing carbamoyl-phosphate synthase small subunit, partial [Candidatus Omnitrophota bacterium]
SSWRSKKTLAGYLKENNIMGIEGIDTRALTRHIRLKGSMKAVLSTKDMDKKSLIKKANAFPGLVGRDIVKEVSTKKSYQWNKDGKHSVTVLDCGVKYNILRNLSENNCKVTVVPANTTAEEILAKKPDGIVLSNGPGDPEGVPYVVDTVKKLLGKLPIFGICLGNQMLGLAMGGKTYKLKFGHHGGNQPVMDIRTRKVAITAQNHGFCVDVESLPKEDIEITHVNLNDNTLEGIKHKNLPIFSVQFHPEHGPGPHDAKYLFGEFVDMMEKHNAKKR